MKGMDKDIYLTQFRLKEQAKRDKVLKETELENRERGEE